MGKGGVRHAERMTGAGVSYPTNTIAVMRGAIAATVPVVAEAQDVRPPRSPDRPWTCTSLGRWLISDCAQSNLHTNLNSGPTRWLRWWGVTAPVAGAASLRTGASLLCKCSGDRSNVVRKVGLELLPPVWWLVLCVGVPPNHHRISDPELKRGE